MSDIIGPPTSYTQYGDDIYSNLDHKIEEDVKEIALNNPYTFIHSAYGFNGTVWFHDGKWYEQVYRYHEPIATYSDESLEDLMKTVNDEHGWE